MKLTLRKAAAVGQEVRRQLSNQIRLATDTRTVNLRAISTVTTAEAVQAAEEDRSALLGKLETLQAISTKIRRAIAEGNIQFGVNEILHKLRETEDRLSIVSDFLVEPSKGNPDYDGYGSFEDAVSQIQLYEKELESSDVRRRVGKSETQVRLVSGDDLFRYRSGAGFGK